MELPGASKKIIGMCYDVKGGGSSFGMGANSMMLRVPFIEQKHVNLCSDASALMIIQAWGYQSNTTTDTNPRGALQGANITDHQFATAGPIRWGSTDFSKNPSTLIVNDYLLLLQMRGPLGASFSRSVAGQHVGHCVVLIGADADFGQLTVHDPWRGPRLKMSLADFNSGLAEIAWISAIGETTLSAADPNTVWKN